MKYSLLMLISIFSFTIVYSQGSFGLDLKVCDSSKVIYSDILQRSDGSFFICGQYVDAGIYFTPVLIKLDKNYNEIMRKVYHASIKRDDKFLQIKEMPNGNLLILGNLESKDGAFAGIDTNTITPCGRIFIAEMDTLGNFIKTKIYAYCGQTIPTDIVLDRHHNIYVSGHTNSQYFDFSDNPEGGFETNSFLIRLDTAFNTKWLTIFDAPGSQDIEPNICINNKDEILYVTNSLYKGGYFSATLPTPTGFIYVSCIDSNKTLKWQKCYGSINNAIGTDNYESPTCITYDSVTQSTFIIGFCTSKDGDLYDNLDQNPWPWSEASFVFKLDSMGNKMWSHRYGGFSATNPFNSKNPRAYTFDGIYKQGFLYLLNTVMYSDSAWTGVASNEDQQTDQWLIKIDSIGVINNKIRIGGPFSDGIQQRLGSLLDYNSQSNGIIFGIRGGSFPCYPGTISSSTIFEANIWPTVVEETKYQQSILSLSPNPANTYCELLFKEATKENYALTLYDLQGKKIVKQNIAKNTRVFKLNIHQLNPGMYLLQVGSKTNKISLKLEKN